MLQSQWWLCSLQNTHGKNLAPIEDDGCLCVVVTFLNLFFNWRKTALQCCDSFRCTPAEISRNCTYTAPLLSLQPTALDHQSAWLGSPCCIATSYQLCSLPMGVSMCLCEFLHSSHSLLPSLCSQVCCLLLSLHSFPVIVIFVLGSINALRLYWLSMIS